MKSKKKRLFYDAFSSGRVREFKSGLAFGFTGGPRSKLKDVRLSRELFVVALLLVVVFLGTSYYVGTLRGRDGERPASLSHRTKSEAPDALESALPTEQTFWAVRVQTVRWGVDTRGKKITEQQAISEADALCTFLEGKGMTDVLAIQDRARQCIYVSIGRSPEPDDLSELMERIKKVEYGSRKKAFADSHLKQVTVEVP